MTSPRINWEKREDHPLMRKPERCEDCGYVHMPDESCRAPIACMTCGSPAGFYYIDKGNPDRECHNCFKERTR